MERTDISTAAQSLIIDLCKDEETKKNPAMVSAIAELYKAVKNPMY